MKTETALKGNTPAYSYCRAKWHEEELMEREEEACILDAFAQAFRKPGERITVKVDLNCEGKHWLKKVERLAKKMRMFFPIEFSVDEGDDPDWRRGERLYIRAPMSGMTVPR